MSNSLTFAVPVNWDNSNTYEINMIVFVGKKAYTAIQNVPTGVNITNTDYWAETGVPYLDVSDIRQKLNELDDEVTGNTGDIEQAQADIIVNANNITALTNRLTQDIANLETQITRINNIMISLYTPYPTTNDQGGN